MSFLSGIVNAGKAVAGYLSGNSWGASLAKTVALGYAVNQMSSSARKANNKSNNNIDEGVRLQIPPANDNKIPVLYGDAYFGGVISDAEMTSNNKTMYYCLTLSEKTGNKLSDGTATNYNFRDVYWNDQRVVFRSDGITVDYSVDRQGNIDRSLSGYVKIYFYAGDVNSGIIPENYTGTVPPATDVMPSWSAGTHNMTDLVFAVVRVDYNRERGIQGIGDLTFQVASDMILPGDVLYDYMTNELYGAGIEASKIDTSKLGELNTYSSESVSYTDEGTGPATLDYRYQINGVIDTDETVLENAEAIASAAATWISYDVHEGMWTFVINRASSSVASFDDTNILGNISLQGTGISELYNTVKVQFPHRELRDSADFVRIEIPQADKNADEVANRLNLSYSIINEPVHAEQLGLIELKQSRIDLMISFQTDYSYINLNAGDVIDVTNSRFGYTNKPFRVITVEELQDDAGALVVDILALEYDDNVYDISDITRYVRSDENGIITIGSIGVPGTPQVTKFERSSRPRIVIDTTTPSGVVDGLEYWLSNDVTLQEDDRSYRLVAERRPTEEETFPAGSPVNIELDSIPQGDFVIKIRAFNSVTVGPYTAPSGLIEYRPVQTTDAITPDTDFLDSLGNVALALTVIDLLKGLDGLYQGVTGNKGIFDIIFDKFEDVTGVDILGDASEGSLVVAAELATLDNGTLIESKTNSYNFVGSNVNVSSDANGNITIDFGQAGQDAVVPLNEPEPGDFLVWNGKNWISVPNCCSTIDWPEGQSPGDVADPEPPEPPEPTILTFVDTLPVNSYNWNWEDAQMAPPLVPHTGSLFIRFNKGRISPSTLLTPLSKGTGSVQLYSTDGELIETLTEADIIIHNDQVELPFGDRVLGEDYYVLVDEGLVEYCGYTSPALDRPVYWSFSTAVFEVDPYTPSPRPLATLNPTLPTYAPLTYTISPSGSNVCPGTNAVITFSEEVDFIGGEITLTNTTTNTVIEYWQGGPGVFTGNQLTLTIVGDLNFEHSYELYVEPDCFVTTRESVNLGECGVDYIYNPPQEFNLEGTRTWTVTNAPALIDYQLVTFPWDEGDLQKVNIRSNIRLEFNKNVYINPNNSYVYLFRASDDTLIQTFDLNADFESNKIGLINKDTSTSIMLNPTEVFEVGMEYYVNTSAGFVRDACQTEVPAINDKTTISWKTDEITIPESGTNSNEVDPADTELKLEFDRPVTPGSGTIEIRDDQGTLIGEIPSDDPAVQIGLRQE